MRAWRSIEKGYIIQSDALGDWERVPRWKTRSSRRIRRRIEPAIHRSIPLRFLTYRHGWIIQQEIKQTQTQFYLF